MVITEIQDTSTEPGFVLTENVFFAPKGLVSRISIPGMNVPICIQMKFI